MREAYAERLRVLMETAESGALLGLVTIPPIQAGIQTAAMLPTRMREVEVARAAGNEGMGIIPLSTFQIDRNDINGLMLGFANTPPAAIRAAAK